ncbi:MAG: exodeoxyribonuclease VII small subunit [Anaerolineae bacterium]|nr:exodeoxyribonuclease VII small subunit [Anaerolineae bacterium]
MDTNRDAVNGEALGFEAALSALEDVVTRLEAGTLELEEAVALYQRGRALSARCQALLDQAELRIQQLSPGGEGASVLEPFDADG